MKTIFRTTVIAVAILSFSLFLLFSLGIFGQSCPPGNTAGQRHHFAMRPNSEKVAVWTARLQSIQQSEELTAEQQAVMATAFSLLTVENFEAGADPDYENSKLKEDMVAFEAAALDAFGKVRTFEIFMTIPSYTSEQSFEEDLMQRPQCACSKSWGCADDGWSTTCRTGCTACSCSPYIGCGPFWSLECNGKCTYS